jgi:F-type H+-transporting ATPase subunit delta
MSDITTARPYAKAVFELADADKSYDHWNSTLQFLSVASADDKVQLLFTTPSMRSEERGEAFLKLCEGHIDEKGASFVRVLAENDRLPLLSSITELYKELSEEAQNIVDATVSSAFEVSAQQQESIQQALSSKLGKTVKVTCVVDESLVGGVVIRAGDLVIDGSIQNRIAQLAGELVK